LRIVHTSFKFKFTRGIKYARTFAANYQSNMKLVVEICNWQSFTSPSSELGAAWTTASVTEHKNSIGTVLEHFEV
jgi:hypothetical protein